MVWYLHVSYKPLPYPLWVRANSPSFAERKAHHQTLFGNALLAGTFLHSQMYNSPINTAFNLSLHKNIHLIFSWNFRTNLPSQKEVNIYNTKMWASSHVTVNCYRIAKCPPKILFIIHCHLWFMYFSLHKNSKTSIYNFIFPMTVKRFIPSSFKCFISNS
jgi:hypothetical protein